jgi:hypothetical protein
MWIFVFPSPDPGKEKLRSRWKCLLGLPPSLGIRNTAKRQAESPQAEARRFSKQNWRIFLPVAHAGWGWLLFRAAQARLHSWHALAVGSRPRKQQLVASG